jgi:hypothetical protein
MRPGTGKYSFGGDAWTELAKRREIKNRTGKS